MNEKFEMPEPKRIMQQGKDSRLVERFLGWRIYTYLRGLPVKDDCGNEFQIYYVEDEFVETKIWAHFTTLDEHGWTWDNEIVKDLTEEMVIKTKEDIYEKAWISHMLGKDRIGIKDGETIKIYKIVWKDGGIELESDREIRKKVNSLVFVNDKSIWGD